ncbi:MAG: histidinol dehydrogenase [Alphaproteobacteria bacterium]|nr:histidinol dehydrogenase [Alphaproteobacteria bacterium]
MTARLSSSQPDFDTALAAFLASRRTGVTARVDGPVREIIQDVQTRGVAAVLDATAKFDRFTAADADALRVDPSLMQAALTGLTNPLRTALETAAARIRAFHEKQLPEGFDYTDDIGVRLGMRWSAIDAVGLYVPGGAAAYPSSVLMNAIPAKVAGVQRLAMVAPTPDGKDNAMVLAAAALAGADEVWRIGGAQAVAALAYGADPIQPVDKIVGPGNAYVAEAKRQVFGQVGIDMIAGPSEVLIVADETADPRWLALDLLAQAEHDADAQSILISDSARLLDQVATAVDAELATLPRGETAGASWRDHGGLILVDDLMAEAPSIVDRIAPEHLELAVANPDLLAAKVRHAGAIFLGAHTPEAVGDYVGGPNHVLPTSGAARFSSGLGVLDFMKRTTLLGCDAKSLAEIGPHAAVLAESEGLDAHGLSVTARFSQK